MYRKGRLLIPRGGWGSHGNREGWEAYLRSSSRWCLLAPPDWHTSLRGSGGGVLGSWFLVRKKIVFEPVTHALRSNHVRGKYNYIVCAGDEELVENRAKKIVFKPHTRPLRSNLPKVFFDGNRSSVESNSKKKSVYSVVCAGRRYTLTQLTMNGW